MTRLAPRLSKPTIDDISDVRRQIDAIDSQLADLIAQRCGLSGRVAAAKRAAGDQAFGWRPAREVEILRTVMRAQASLNPELAFRIWRALMSANLVAQGGLAIVTVAQAQEAAKAAFSVGTRPSVFASALQALDAVVQNPNAIAVLPWPTDDDWWVAMMAPAYSNLFVCAASPLCGGDAEALLIATQPVTQAGDDISLIAGPIGAIEGGVLAQSGDLELVAIGEFMAPGTPLPDGCRLIGGFALA
jgi:chorismate mutase